jgi:hypothetical protein
LHAGGETLANMQASTVAVVEHASGGSMRDYVHRAMARSRDKKGGRAYSYCDALRWALQSAKGLQYLHGQRPAPLLHGAISLDNVLLKGGWLRPAAAAAVGLGLGATHSRLSMRAGARRCAHVFR